MRELYVQATSEAEAYQLCELLSGSVCYWLALLHGASAEAAAADAQLPSAEKRRGVGQYAGRAVELLKRARLAGWFRVFLRDVAQPGE